MFEFLDKIEWASLRCQGGDATHVPKALIEVCSSDERTSEAAYWKLENHVFSQNTLYSSAEAVLLVLPDLWRVAHFKGHILNLLFLITFACPDCPEPLYQNCYRKGIEAYRKIMIHEPPNSRYLAILRREFEGPGAN